MQANTCAGLTRDLGGEIRGSTDPLAMLIGAGCSISSGAPSTASVDNILVRATAGRSNGQIAREYIHDINQAARQAVLEPLFARVHPHLGYKSLAALARIRRIYVLNLNWDRLVEEACERANVPCVSLELSEQAGWTEIDDLPTGLGMVCVHMHGALGGLCQYSRMETARFTPEQKQFIKHYFWDNRLLIVGASLQGDDDLADMWRDHLFKERKNSVWYFGRRGHNSLEIAQAQAREQMYATGARPREFYVGDDVDFDQIMLGILEEVKELRWEGPTSLNSSVPLPSSSELLFVEPDTLRRFLDYPALAITGEPFQGKTVLAHFLAHCYRLWSDKELKLRYCDTPTAAALALTSLERINAEVSESIYLIEDPFGSTSRYEANPAFLAALNKFYRLDDPIEGIPKLLVTSRRTAWDKAQSQSKHESLPVTMFPVETSSWFNPRTLRKMAVKVPRVASYIDQGYFRTPGTVRYVLDHYGQDSSGLKSFVEKGGEIVQDTVDLLEAFPEVGKVCAVVRLQDFCPRLCTAAELLDWADVEEGHLHANKFLHQYTFEETKRLKLDHPFTQEATDLYLKGHCEELAESFEDNGYLGQVPRNALIAWKALESFGDALGREPNDEALRQWGAVYLTRTPSLNLLESALAAVTDQWALTELTHESVRCWDLLLSGEGGKDRKTGRRERRALLQKINGDRRNRGTYALFEACLYLQSTVDSEIRAEVESRIRDLVHEPTAAREVALLVDGWMWRPLSNEETPEWLVAYLSDLDEADDNWYLIRFLQAYHPEGFDCLPADLKDRDRGVKWTVNQAGEAAWLVGWHFVHQAHSRRLLSRMRVTDKNFLCRSLHPSIDSPTSEAAWYLIRSLADFPEFAGWAFHAGSTLACWRNCASPKFGDLMKQVLKQVQAADVGLITSSLTNASVTSFRRELRDYFYQEANKEALLTALSLGVNLEDVAVREPRFIYARNPAEIHELLDVNWTNASKRGLQVNQPRHLAAEFWSVAQEAVKEGKISVGEVERVAAYVEAGDLRLLEKYATAARSGKGTAMEQIFSLYLADERRNAPELKF